MLVDLCYGIISSTQKSVLEHGTTSLHRLSSPAPQATILQSWNGQEGTKGMPAEELLAPFEKAMGATVGWLRLTVSGHTQT